jgi:hypothetical protein
MDILDDVVRSWAVQPWRWGWTDCSASVLHFARVMAGRHDEPWPLHHRTARGAALAIARAGGLDALAARYLEPLGFARCVGTPQRFDIGVIDQGDGEHRMGIFTGRRFAVRAQQGVHVSTPRAVIALWRRG